MSIVNNNVGRQIWIKFDMNEAVLCAILLLLNFWVSWGGPETHENTDEIGQHFHLISRVLIRRCEFPAFFAH